MGRIPRRQRQRQHFVQIWPVADDIPSRVQYMMRWVSKAAGCVDRDIMHQRPVRGGGFRGECVPLPSSKSKWLDFVAFSRILDYPCSMNSC